MQPLISIIIPVYNVEKFLHQCLDSIIAQSYTNFEAVLVDDGSKDGSGKICDEYAQKDNRIVVVHKENEGVAKARITAFEHSHGELITFVDSDDYVTSDYLEKLSKPILNDDADMVSCDYFKVVNGVVKRPRPKLDGTYQDEQIQHFVANHYFYDESCTGFGMTNFLCTKMVKREYVLDGLRHGLGLWFGEDQIAMFSMLQECKKLVLTSEKMYYYVMHKGQAVSRYDESLWTSLVHTFERYRDLSKCNCWQGLRKRIWLYVFKTISDKMIPNNIDRKTFVEHMQHVRKYQLMEDFYKGNSTGLGLNNDIGFWLLKLRMYNVTYMLFKLRR